MEGAPKIPGSRELQYPEISSEILRMAEEDQKMRLDPRTEWDPDIDERNTERMKAIIQEIGWPTKSKVGEFASDRAWLLIQHADHDPSFQKQCLELLKAESAEEINISNIGYLEDRIRVKNKELQSYGTQFYTDEKGIFGPYPIEDPEHIDERRKSLEMGSFDEYQRLMLRLHREDR